MDCDKCTTLTQDVNNSGNWEDCEGAYGNSLYFLSFFFPENKLLVKMEEGFSEEKIKISYTHKNIFSRKEQSRQER